MYVMFSNCHKLLFINLSSFDTTKVENMRGLFYWCYKLRYLDLQNFSASSITTFSHVFTNCTEIVYVNLRNFKITNFNEVVIKNTFSGVPSTTKFCIEDLETKNFLLANKSVDCSDFCFQENVIFDINNNQSVCNEYYKFEYNNKCYQECPNGMSQIKTDKYICSNSAPENYYLDNNDNIYKECYSLCTKCRNAGDSSNHNCDSCKEGYTFINDSQAIKNFVIRYA